MHILASIIYVCIQMGMNIDKGLVTGTQHFIKRGFKQRRLGRELNIREEVMGQVYRA